MSNPEYQYFPVNQKRGLSVTFMRKKKIKPRFTNRKKNQFSPGHSPTSVLQKRNKAKNFLLCSFRQSGPKGSRQGRMNSKASLV